MTVSRISYLRGYPTTSISGNNVRKVLLENDFLSSCSGIPALKLLYFRKCKLTSVLLLIAIIAFKNVHTAQLIFDTSIVCSVFNDRDILVHIIIADSSVKHINILINLWSSYIPYRVNEILLCNSHATNINIYRCWCVNVKSFI